MNMELGTLGDTPVDAQLSQRIECQGPRIRSFSGGAVLGATRDTPHGVWGPPGLYLVMLGFWEGI